MTAMLRRSLWSRRWPGPPGTGLDPRHHHIFDLDIFFHAVMRALAPQAAFLDAAEGCYFGGDQAGVAADHAGFESLGYPPDPAEIARVEIRSKPERRVVAHRDHVGLVLEAEHRRQGT